MAEFKAYLAFDYRSLDLYRNYEHAHFVPDSHDPSHKFYVYPSARTAITIEGEGFDYLPNGVPYTGTSEAAYFFILNQNEVYRTAYALTDISVKIQDAGEYLEQSPERVAADIFVGHDYFYGSKFDDHINGYKGRNELTGGKGEDHFYFTYREASSNFDTIKDFEHKEDYIVLENSEFRRISNNNIENRFVDEAKGEVEKSDRVIYNSDNGKLWYDRNGSDTGGATLIAKLNPDGHGDHPVLSHHDILVV